MNNLIETKRLILREFKLIDANCFYELNSDPEVIRFTGDQPFQSVVEAELFLREYKAYKLTGFGRWAVISKDSGSFLGWCGLKLNEENLIDIGFRFFRREWGKGYATESAKAVLKYGFNHLGLDLVIARASIKNIASIKVLEKLKMRFWKHGNIEGLDKSVYYRISYDQFKGLDTF